MTKSPSNNDMQLIGPRTVAIAARDLADELDWLRTQVREHGTQNVYGHIDALVRTSAFLRQIEAAAVEATALRVDDNMRRLG